MLVAVPVSSMKTSRSTSRVYCSPLHAARATATSGRSCSAARTVFFKADAMSVVEPPDGSDANGKRVCGGEPGADLFKRQIGLPGHQLEQPLLMGLERRAAVPGAGLGERASRIPKTPNPTDRRRVPNAKMSGRLTRRFTSLHERDHSNPQVLRVASCHRRLPPKRGRHRI